MVPCQLQHTEYTQGDEGHEGDEEHTIEVGRPHKGDVNTQISMVGGTIEAQVNAERN